MAFLVYSFVRMILSKSLNFLGSCSNSLAPFICACPRQTARSSKRQDLACTGHDNFCRMALHRRDEVACVPIEKIEGPVVAGDNGIEFEEKPDRQRRRPPAHGKTGADRHQGE